MDDEALTFVFHAVVVDLRVVGISLDDERQAVLRRGLHRHAELIQQVGRVSGKLEIDVARRACLREPKLERDAALQDDAVLECGEDPDQVTVEEEELADTVHVRSDVLGDPPDPVLERRLERLVRLVLALRHPEGSSRFAARSAEERSRLEKSRRRVAWWIARSTARSSTPIAKQSMIVRIGDVTGTGPNEVTSLGTRSA